MIRLDPMIRPEPMTRPHPVVHSASCCPTGCEMRGVVSGQVSLCKEEREAIRNGDTVLRPAPCCEDLRVRPLQAQRACTTLSSCACACTCARLEPGYIGVKTSQEAVASARGGEQVCHLPGPGLHVTTRQLGAPGPAFSETSASGL